MSVPSISNKTSRTISCRGLYAIFYRLAKQETVGDGALILGIGSKRSVSALIPAGVRKSLLIFLRKLLARFGVRSALSLRRGFARLRRCCGTLRRRFPKRG